MTGERSHFALCGRISYSQRLRKYSILLCLAICPTICLAVWAPTMRAAVADTAPERRPDNTRAVLANPLGPSVGVVTQQLLALPVVSANLRYQRAFTERLGLMVAPQFVYSNLFGIRNYVLAAKVGPRISLSRRYLAGWYVFPMAVLGWGVTTQLDRRLHSSGIAGLGLEVGRAWHWRWFVFEAGVGLHYTGYVAHFSPLSGKAGAPPAGGFGPIVNLSIGYGWSWRPRGLK